jgi:hypothetical protein
MYIFNCLRNSLISPCFIHLVGSNRCGLRQNRNSLKIIVKYFENHKKFRTHYGMKTKRSIGEFRIQNSRIFLNNIENKITISFQIISLFFYCRFCISKLRIFFLNQTKFRNNPEMNVTQYTFFFNS